MDSGFSKRGLDLLKDPALNKGTAFPLAERRALGLEGLLPPRVESLETQVQRSWEAFGALTGDLERFAFVDGINPERVLAVALDVGTNRLSLLADPLDPGLRPQRLEEKAYLAFVEEFVEAVAVAGVREGLAPPGVTEAKEPPYRARRPRDPAPGWEQPRQEPWLQRC